MQQGSDHRGASPRHAATQGANTPADAPKRGAEGGAGAGERVTAQEGTELLDGQRGGSQAADDNLPPLPQPRAGATSPLPAAGESLGSSAPTSAQRGCPRQGCRCPGNERTERLRRGELPGSAPGERSGRPRREPDTSSQPRKPFC